MTGVRFKERFAAFRQGRSARFWLCAVGLALFLAGCAGGTRVSYLPVPSDPPPVPAPKPAVPPGALRLASNNGFAAAAPGQGGSLVPATVAQVYRVRPGDTVAGLARRLEVPQESLIEINRLTAPYRLTVGQSLRLPAGRRYLVARGDTLYGIARRYGVAMTELARLNGLESPDLIRPGRTLMLPPEASPAPGSEPSETRLAAAPAAAPTTEAIPTSDLQWRRQTVAAAPQPPSVAALQPTSLPTALPVPLPRDSGKFLWPVQGSLLAGYGAKKDGLHNDGINIAAPRGSLVRAAENGVVAYAGNELRGFGNLILIKHDGGWVTAYGHTEEFLVGRGERVARGQPIARVGATGNVAQPQLHFEIREGTHAVDPLRLLEIQSAEAS